MFFTKLRCEGTALEKDQFNKFKIKKCQQKEAH